MFKQSNSYQTTFLYHTYSIHININITQERDQYTLKSKLI